MKISSLATLAFLVGALPLRAEAPRFGVQGLVNLSLGDLKAYVDNQPGPGFGIHATFDMSDGHMLRPRLDYTLYPEASFTPIKQTASNFSLGGDYLYFIAEKLEGLYLTCGVSAVHWTFEHKDPTSKTTSSTTRIGMAAGLGYQWNATVGTELRWLHSTAASTFKADAVQVGATIRF